GRGEGMQAVARELAGRDVVADTAVAHAVGQQLLDHAVELPPGPDDLRVAVQEGRQTTFVMTSGVVRGEGEGPQYRLELFTGVRALIADLDQVLEVVADLALVPGEQDRLDIGKVLVQRGAPDPGVLGDLRHRHRRESAFCDQCRGGVQHGGAYGGAVRVDRLRPQLRHTVS